MFVLHRRSVILGFWAALPRSPQMAPLYKGLRGTRVAQTPCSSRRKKAPRNPVSLQGLLPRMSPNHVIFRPPATVADPAAGFQLQGWRLQGCEVASIRLLHARQRRAGLQIAGYKIATCDVAGCKVAGCKVAGCKLSGQRLQATGCAL